MVYENFGKLWLRVYLVYGAAWRIESGTTGEKYCSPYRQHKSGYTPVRMKQRCYIFSGIQEWSSELSNISTSSDVKGIEPEAP